MGTVIEVATTCIITVWRRSGPSIIGSATPKEPFRMEFDQDVVRIVIT